MASKPVFRMIFLAISVYTGYGLSSAIKALNCGGSFSPNLVRLTVLSTRGGKGSGFADISGFGLLRDGCKISGNSTGSNNTWTIYSASALGNVNGYYFTLENKGSRLVQSDPLSWTVEASLDNGSSWISVGASVWRTDSSGNPELYPYLFNDPRGTTLESHGPLEFDADMRPPLSWVLNTLAEYAVFSVGFAVAVFTAQMGRVSTVKVFWVLILSTDALLYSASNFVIMNSEPWLQRYALELSADIVLQVVLAVGTAAAEAHVILILVVCCLLNNIFVALCDLISYQRAWEDILLDRLHTMAGMGVVFGVGALIFRQRALVQAYSLILADKLRYESIWKAVIVDPNLRMAVISIQEATMTLTKDIALYSRLRPVLRQRSPDFEDRGRRSSMLLEFVVETGKNEVALCLGRKLHHKFAWNSKIDRIDSLDQLFVQAWCLSPILLAKTKAWALLSKGCFGYQPHDSENFYFKQYSEDPDDEDVGSFKWARVKSIKRAVEKTVRIYKQVLFVADF